MAAKKKGSAKSAQPKTPKAEKKAEVKNTTSREVKTPGHESAFSNRIRA